MASAIPPSYTFEMLSKLPPNSFVVQWKELRPAYEPPRDTSRGSLGQKLRYSFLIRGAPNEFLLNTNVYLCGNSYVRVAVSNTADITEAEYLSMISTGKTLLNPAYKFFGSSRESFNSGALPLLDNQDNVRHSEYNHLRALCTRRNFDSKHNKLSDINGFSGGFDTLNISVNDIDITQRRGIRYAFRTTASNNTYTPVSTGDYKFQLPLGLYSNLVNSHSVLPIGLFSSYAVNGWQLDIETSLQAPVIPNNSTTSGYCWAVSSDTTNTVIGIDGVLSNLRIYYPIIKVLDPSVMSAVLSLYEKQEMVNVGGVQFPLSLRLNTLGYRFFSFPLRTTESDYRFRLAGTDKSVRAYAFKIYDRTRNSDGYQFLSNNFRVVRLQTDIGTEMPHDVIEDPTPETTNVPNFLNTNARHSASVFSSLPYYQEGITWGGHQEDDLQMNNMPIGTYEGRNSDNVIQSLIPICYGVVSLENLDRREKDYSGSFQASGKDLTNVGSIDVSMRIKVVSAVPAIIDPSGLKIAAIDNLYTVDPPPDNNAEIIFMYAYDQVMEVSPQGVMDITNAVL